MSQDKTPPAKDAGAEYAEIWGEAIHCQPSPSDHHGGAWHCGNFVDYRGHSDCLSRSPPAHCGDGWMK